MAHMVDREEQDLLVALLLLSHDEGDIDHDEFLLLLVVLEEGNPCPLNQAIGRRLCFDLLDEETCLRRFRFSKDQLTELCQLLRLPDKMNAACRTTWSGLEGLLVVLRRLCYPNRLGDLCEEFGRSKGVLSLIFNVTLVWIYQQWGGLMENPFQRPFLSNWRLHEYRTAIHRRTGIDLKIVGFIDGTVRPICRPTVNQRDFYNGHKRTHALKYQSVTAPDGLILCLYGPIEGKRHDAGMLRESGLLALLYHHLQIPGGQGTYALYGDPAYPLSSVIQKAFPAAGITPQRQAFNTHMSGARQSVEWGFAEIITKWAYVDFKKQQKIGLQAVGLHYRVAAFLTNCRTILRGGNKTSRFFRVDPPTLAVYLQWSYSCNGVPNSQCKRLDQPVHQM